MSGILMAGHCIAKEAAILVKVSVAAVICLD
jgi:hypothetical protein